MRVSKARGPRSAVPPGAAAVFWTRGWWLLVAQGGSGLVAAAAVVVVGLGSWLLLLWLLSVVAGGEGGVLATGQHNTVFICMLPWVLVQQVSYTLARERAYFPQNGVGACGGVAVCVCTPRGF